LLVAAANCDWKLKRLNKQELERLPDTQDETGARRLYLLMELARDKDDGSTQQYIVDQMKARFAESPWLAEALYSSGNMYLLRKDYSHAIDYYGELAKRFPKSCEPTPTAHCSNYSPSSHWRAAWLNYRLKQYSEAARLMDEQIANYPRGKEIPGALYWRGRIYEQMEHRPEMAATYYRTLARVYQHYYYAAEAKQRLATLGNLTPEYVAMLTAMHPETIPELSDDVPEDDPHVVKARLLANAGLNEFIPQEIQAADGSSEWGSFAEADIYNSYGETFRAMRVLKRAIPYYTSAPIPAMPLAYWRILFPEAYWPQIKASAAANGLDPYMVASLIRQESEFNPQAISNKSAYGLMQLLPSVGKSMAKAEGMKHFEASQLLDPIVNIQLGCRYLKQTMDKFGGQPEYVFAAYNAGDARVIDWRSSAGEQSIDEFVESIPFTETRDYVQAILRNEDIYRALDQAAAQTASRERTN
jgi:soluble lytic murein transglycosylase